MKISKILSFLLFLFLVAGCCVDSSSYTEEIVSDVRENDLVFTNRGDENILLGNVLIYNNNYSSVLGLTYRKNNTYGSGFIFYEDSNYYYILTNNHVVSYDYTYMYNELIVEDYYGNEYNGEVLKTSVNYDLAVVRIEKNAAELGVLTISDDNENIRSNVKAVGNPDEIKNVISEGKINCYSKVNVKNDKSKVDFEVIVHTAPISGGSSGGALLNDQNEVIGVTFAGVFDSENNFITAYAIPASEIDAFLN